MDCASPRPTRKTKTAAAHGTCHVIKDSNVGRILTAWTCKFAATAPGVTLLFVSTGPCHVHTKSIARLIKLTKFQKCESVHKLCLTVKVSDGNTTEISSTVEGQNEFTTTEQSCSSWEEWGACSPTTCLRKRRKSKTLPECLPFSDRELCGDCTTSKGSIQEIKNGLRIKFGKKFMRAVLKNLDLAIEMIVNKVNDFCTENTGYCCESLGKKNSLKIVGKFDITDTSLVKIADGFPQTVDEEAVLKLIFKVKVGSTAKCSSFEVGRAKRAVDEGYVQSTILKLSSESAAEQIKAVLGVPEIELEDPAIEVMTSGIASWLWVTIFVAPIVVVFVITVFVMCCCTRKQTSSKSFRPIEIEILSPGHSGIPPGNFKGSPEYPRETIKQRWYPGNFYSYKP
ncbi:hypothetical protein CAPTEDRAFT_227910 [Capitella teleta]|uniref:Uncharacterized protein n=1 Tax=Capitella teleta TaxID=283909 RepID=R7U244_CAPTE|nr:hypothetical protein CAPTEDRAFT_227910 [Capitella teleta]|eukprot:ELT99942.1 hypothetical protein CAPTEDRAFT_227910 [Capitella teleta]